MMLGNLRLVRWLTMLGHVGEAEMTGALVQ